MIDDTHDPQLESWVTSANDPATDFPIQSLPYATFRREGEAWANVGVAIGDQVLDVSTLFRIDSLKSLMTMPRRERKDLRYSVSRLLRSGSVSGMGGYLTPMSQVQLLLPCEIGDYTDFYASIHHATNVGRMFRPDNPLLPNYRWLPVAYHGRASSVVPSGTPVRRPMGQIEPGPAYAPTACLDYEVELGAFIGPGNAMGEPIPIGRSEDHIFGVCLLNDWSARDIQAWEYQPLGPFLAKNFATSISPWIVTMEALQPFRCPADPHDRTLPYLQTDGDSAFRITLEVWLRSARMTGPVLVSQGDFQAMYWTLAQMVAHHTCNGCPLRPGDLMGSGTVSGPEKRNRGCLLEMTARGAEPLRLPTGEERGYLEDGDEVILRGWCEAPGFRRIGFGECRGMIAPALTERR